MHAPSARRWISGTWAKPALFSPGLVVGLKRRGQQAAVLAGDSGLGRTGEPLIGRPSTLAVSDLETSSSGAKAQTLRCDFEGLQAPS